MIPLSPVSPYEKIQDKVSQLPSDEASDGEAPCQRSAGWKPHTLRPPLLSAVVICFIVLIATLEYLSRLSEQRGALVTGCDGFTAGTTFMYLYFPTILSVSLSQIWGWIDLDAKRLEPYFQMSKSDGASPKNSLDLHYPFDFVALAPLKAVRNRHWAVAASGTTMLMIFWSLTPLIGTIFAKKDVMITQHPVVEYNHAIPPPEKQVEDLTNRFFTLAYQHIWAGQALPAFTTPNAALLPFEVKSRVKDLSNATWSATTKMYFTSLSCNNASLTADGKNFDNGKGCSVSKDYISPAEEGNVRLMYIGYPTSDINDYYLSGLTGCDSTYNEHTFFGAAKGTVDQQSLDHTFFCEPSYWQQDVNATVLASNQSVLMTRPIGPPVPLSMGIFNATNFEYILNAQSPYVSKRADIIDTSERLRHELRLTQTLSLNINNTFTPLMALAVANKNLPLSTYLLNLEALFSSLQSAHELLFALALQSLLTTTGNATTSSSAVENYTCQSVLILRKLAIAVEVFLAIVACLTGLMIWIYGCRPSEIMQDVRSLSEISKLVDKQHSQPLTAGQPKDQSTDTPVLLRRGRVQISANSRISQAKRAVDAEALPFPDLTSTVSSNAAESWEISKITGAVFLSVLFAATTVILTIYILIEARHGLPQPSANDSVNQILTNYLPIAFANLLEPFWTLLNRNLCVMRPFQALAQGNTPVYKSLDLKYTSLPPQLAFWRAIRVGDFPLVLVCIIGLSANILAVAFSGLFTTSSIPFNSTALFTQSLQPRFEQIHLASLRGYPSNEVDSGILLATASSLMNSSAPPPWVWNDTFFLPFDISPETDHSFDAKFSAKTYGFVSEVACFEVEYDSTAFVHSDSAGPDVDILHGKRCSNPSRGPMGGQNRTRMAAEISTGLFSNDSEADCGSKFLTGFLRANYTISLNETKTDNQYGDRPRSYEINELDATWMICDQKLQVAKYLVIIDQSSRVLSAERSDNSFLDTAQLFSPQLNESYLMAQSAHDFTVGPNVKPWWHNDTFVDSWFGYIIKLIDPKFIDPSSPPPAFEDVQDAVKAGWKRMFAVRLGMSQSWFSKAAPGTRTTGHTTTKETRITMSRPAFAISVILLAANIAAAVLYYCFQRPTVAVLPKMPITIGRVLDLFQGSSLSEGEEKVDENTRVGYGQFIGTDSQAHVGIDRTARLRAYQDWRATGWL